MAIVSDNQSRSGRKSAFDEQIILRIVKKRSEPEPGQRSDGAKAKDIQNDINVLMRGPFTQYVRTLENVLIFQDHRR